MDDQDDLGGWLKLYRSIEDHPVWNEKNPLHLKVFAWCLFRARWRDNGVLKRGQFRTTREQGAEMLDLSESTFYRSLKRLEELGCISITPNSQFSVVTVCNYRTYQDDKVDGRTTTNENLNSKRTAQIPEESTTYDDDTSEPEQQVNNKRTTSERPKKKVKKGKESKSLFGDQEFSEQGNSKKKPEREFIEPTLQEVIEYGKSRKSPVDPEYFLAYQQQRGWKLANGQPIESWKGAFVTFEKNQERFAAERKSGNGRHNGNGQAVRPDGTRVISGEEILDDGLPAYYLRGSERG